MQTDSQNWLRVKGWHGSMSSSSVRRRSKKAKSKSPQNRDPEFEDDQVKKWHPDKLVTILTPG